MSSGDALRLCLQQRSQGFTKITNVAITSYQVILVCFFAFLSQATLQYDKGFDVMQMRSMC